LDIGHSALQSSPFSGCNPDLHDTKFSSSRLCRDGHNGLYAQLSFRFSSLTACPVCLLGSGSGRADDEVSTYLKTGIPASVAINMALDYCGHPPYSVVWGSANSNQERKIFVRLHCQSRFDVCALLNDFCAIQLTPSALASWCVMAWRDPIYSGSTTDPDWNYTLYITALQKPSGALAWHHRRQSPEHWLPYFNKFIKTCHKKVTGAREAPSSLQQVVNTSELS